MNLRSKLALAQQHVVQNQTAAMLELGSHLLNQTSAQAYSVEAKVTGQGGGQQAQAILSGPLSG